jgi:hypothetical protein
MAIDRWRPRQDWTKQEQALLRRVRKGRKLFAFLLLRRTLFHREAPALFCES